jgi:hypothetical protein
MIFRECSRHRVEMLIGWFPWGQRKADDPNVIYIPVYYCPMPECGNLRSCKWLPRIDARTFAIMPCSELYGAAILSPPITTNASTVERTASYAKK